MTPTVTVQGDDAVGRGERSGRGRRGREMQGGCRHVSRHAVGCCREPWAAQACVPHQAGQSAPRSVWCQPPSRPADTEPRSRLRPAAGTRSRLATSRLSHVGWSSNWLLRAVVAAVVDSFVYPSDYLCMWLCCCCHCLGGGVLAVGCHHGLPASPGVLTRAPCGCCPPAATCHHLCRWMSGRLPSRVVCCVKWHVFNEICTGHVYGFYILSRKK